MDPFHRARTRIFGGGHQENPVRRNKPTSKRARSNGCPHPMWASGRASRRAGGRGVGSVGRRAGGPVGAAPGFTLIEASMATVIIGVGVLAMVDAQSSFIVSNQWSSHAASATFLANEIRELTRNLPKHDPVVGLFLEDDGTGGSDLRGWGPDAGEVTVEDFDDIDDFDGITFADIGTPGLGDGDLPGPINAFREVILDLDVAGMENGDAMLGWSQSVIVRKVHPFDFSLELDDDFTEPAAGAFPGRAVDRYPLRVRVQVFYQNANDIEPGMVTEVTWIVP